MSTLVAVHGGFAGGFYWQDVVDRLERHGYATAVIERLPSHGTDAGSLGDLTADAAHVRDVIDQIDGPVVLAGHSYSGMVITELADHPAVRHSIYIAAFWPDRGQSTSDMLGGTIPDWIVANDDGTVGVGDASLVIEALGADVDKERAAEIHRRSLPMAMSALTTPSTAPTHTHATTYVITENDQAVPPPAQEAMAQRADHVVRLPTSHWAMFAAPDELASIFMRALDGQ